MGFQDRRITEYFECFSDTSALEKLSKDLLPKGANFYATKKG